RDKIIFSSFIFLVFYPKGHGGVSYVCFRRR
ncbi:MAG: hypothetical protein ACI857_001962, partial [Arenicella sp.]